MTRMWKLNLFSLALCSLAVTNAAHARESFTEGSSAAILSARTGVPLGKNISDNPYSLGVGARYGVTLYGGLYLGLQAQSFLFDKHEEHFGANDDVIIQGRLGSSTVEIGNDWGLLRRLSLRVAVGIGPAWGKNTTCKLEANDDDVLEKVCEKGDNPRAALTASTFLLGNITRHVFATGEAQWLVDSAFEEHTTAAIFALGLGWRF